MSQSLIIIYTDQHGIKSRIKFRQTDQDSVTHMDVQDCSPDELVKLMMLVAGLAEQTIQNLATAKNDANSSLEGLPMGRFN